MTADDLILEQEILQSYVKYLHEKKYLLDDITDKNIKVIDDLLLNIDNYKNDDKLKLGGVPYLIIKRKDTEIISDGNSSPKTDNLFTVKTINTVFEYSNLLKTNYPDDNISANVDDRLCIVFIAKNNTGLPSGTFGIKTTLSPPTVGALNNYKTTLIPPSLTSYSITQSDLSSPEIFNSDYNVVTKTTNSTSYTSYNCLDITNYYLKLYREKNKLNKDKGNLAKTIGVKVNNTILDELGMLPTIYNIFKIILKNIGLIGICLLNIKFICAYIYTRSYSIYKLLIIVFNKN
jgi:hypothetical protein